MTRPALAPGLRVLRRSRDQLQVGLHPERRLLLADTPPVRRALDHLLRGESLPTDRHTERALEQLAPVLVDGTGLVVAGVAPGDVAAVALQDPAAYQDRVAARRRAAVLVTGAMG
ncbi:MAG TPA: hypothetical protein VFO98_13295, partial [Marmoricola sp.]|nr:hypothetical protein [Marmoricola sp.]